MTAPTMFPHPENSRFLISGQANIIFQAHGPFHSPYEDEHSLLSRGEYKTSLVGTLYLGAQLRRDPKTETDAIFDLESAGGRGISEALGLAGFTNLDVVRNPNLGSTPYIARVQLHQTIGFTDKLVQVERTPFSLATQVPERRLEFHVGKIGLPDYLDLNGIGTDSHLQFMNWTVDNNGAWDYAADTRGYTYGLVTEYDDKDWSARYALALMPTVANGIDLDWNLRRASGQNWEFELRKPLFGRLLPPERKGTVRVLSYVNHAHMGLYREAEQGLPLRRRCNARHYEARDLRRREVRLRPERRAGAHRKSAASSPASAGTKASTSPTPTPRSTRPSRSAATTPAARGRAPTTSSA